jgi:methionyl-tRNA formyltransferase
MRIIVCGSGGFGVPTLRSLAAAHEVARVYTQPARPAGRGGQLRPTPLALAAGELGLGVEEIQSINAPAVVEAMAKLSADVMMVMDFGQMIRQAARDTVRLGAFNLHGSVLPELRGAAPVNWAIIRGYTETGVTVFRLVDKMDAGEVFVIKSLAIAPEESADELKVRLAALGVAAVAETLALLAAGQTAGIVQDESKATAAPKLAKPDGVIDFSADAAAIVNRIRGTWPWPGARAKYVAAAGKSVEVTIARARAVGQSTSGAAPGTMTHDLTVATGGGCLQIVEIKPAGSRQMAWRDFVNGHRVAAGDRLESVTP